MCYSWRHRVLPSSGAFVGPLCVRFVCALGAFGFQGGPFLAIKRLHFGNGTKCAAKCSIHMAFFSRHKTRWTNNGFSTLGVVNSQSNGMPQTNMHNKVGPGGSALVSGHSTAGTSGSDHTLADSTCQGRRFPPGTDRSLSFCVLSLTHFTYTTLRPTWALPTTTPDCQQPKHFGTSFAHNHSST